LVLSILFRECISKYNTEYLECQVNSGQQDFAGGAILGTGYSSSDISARSAFR
jgi:hypothetical protein